MSQTNDIYMHLFNYGSITPLQSLKLHGCMRLASRINDLRREGYNITTIMMEEGGKHYAKYVLEK